MPKPAQPYDLRIAYAGSIFMLTPLSPQGQEWLAEATESTEPGPVGLQLRYLDAALAEARKAGLRLDTPWEESDAGED